MCRIMQQLLANLQSDHLNRDVKPDILQVFGDMAQGLGQHFDRYIKDVVETLQACHCPRHSHVQLCQRTASSVHTFLARLRTQMISSLAACWQRSM